MQSEGRNNLYRIIQDVVPRTAMAKKNKAKNWEYGYNEKYDIVVISKNGTDGDIYDIQVLKIGLTKKPAKCYSNEEKCWQPFD